MIFNRFARETRGCVVAAVEEARMLGHDSIGDEDLLLGILRVNEEITAEALSSLGVTLEGARVESEGMLSDALSSVGISLEEVRREAGDAFDMSIPEDRRIPFSPRAKKALEWALREAARLREKRLGAEHVLLGAPWRRARSAGDTAHRGWYRRQDTGPPGRVAGDAGGPAVRIAPAGDRIAVGRRTEGGRAT